MIRYSLRCAKGHVFESWFASAETFDRLARAGGLSCAVCGDSAIEKTLMAPAVGGAAREETPSSAPADAREGETRPMLSAPSSPLEAALRALRAKVEASAENVGRDFPRLAREMHAGEAETRAIYGEATPDEARELLEEGAPVMPLPWPARRND
ncbi:MAG: DUF1178 family protein [Pseudomonadota bacterium]